MRILSLRLKHFKPVKYSLLGRDEIHIDFSSLPDGLIAITGKNGAAKTTIIDNLQPFRVMPFRASQSIADMVYGDGEKELVWEHAGKAYRSLLKVNGKTREMVSFLDEMKEDGSWQPLIDGRNNDYDAEIEKILGISEKMFFITRFRSQDARSFASFKKNDFREVFESMISELGYLVDVSRRAKEKRQQTDSALQAAQKELGGVESVLKSIPEKEPPGQEDINNAELELSGKQSRASEIQELIEGNTSAYNVLKEQERSLIKAADDGKRRLDQRTKEISDRRVSISRKLVELRTLIASKDEINRAKESLPALKERLRVMQERLALRSILVTEMNETSKALTRVKTEILALEKQIKTARDTAKLLHEVPCAGEEKQSTCKLLASANRVAAGIAGLQDELAGLKVDVETGEKLYDEQKTRLVSEFPDTVIPQSLLESINKAQAAAGRAELLAHAESQITELESEDTKLEASVIEIRTVSEEETKKTSSGLERIRSEQTAVAGKLNENKTKKTSLDAESREIAGRLENLRTEKRVCDENERRKVAINEKINEIKTAILGLTRDLRQWKLIEEGFGREGLIALELELAAPAVSDIANALLKEMGGRFAIRFDTLQPKMSRGKVTGYRESFSVKVFDSEKGVEKDIIDLSGGERVWVDEAIARGIAIYNARNSGSDLGFLVSDERDGALDSGKKIEYMSMKRKVLELGGDKQEIFISHTPEVWDLADEVVSVGEAGVILRSGRSVEVNIPAPPVFVETKALEAAREHLPTDMPPARKKKRTKKQTDDPVPASVTPLFDTHPGPATSAQAEPSSLAVYDEECEAAYESFSPG